MTRLGVGVLVVLAVVQLVQAIPPLKCKEGYGLVDPTADPYGEAKPGDCRRCEVKHCQYCSDDYTQCKDGCSAGRGLNSKKNKCVTCKNSNCGVCLNNYKKCTAKIPKCRTKVTKTMDAKRTTYKNLDKEWAGTLDSCFNSPSFNGNGYTSLFIPLVKNGKCVNCEEHWRPGDTDVAGSRRKFCHFDEEGRQVAANAFKKKAGCRYPEDIKLTLKHVCSSNNRGNMYEVVLEYDGTYCGEKKNGIIVQDSGMRSDNFKDHWQYIP